MLKLKRIVAWLQRYKQNVLGMIHDFAMTKDKLLSENDLENTEFELLNHAQKTHFSFIASNS